MKDLEYQAEKKFRQETNPKTVILANYHNFSGVFSEKNSDILHSHQNYDHKIILDKKQNHGHVSLYKISGQKLSGV